MAFCRFCGKEIPEGNICDECKATHPEQNVQPVQPVQNEQTAADSTVTPNPVPTDAPAADNKNKRNLIILGAAAVIILVIIIAIISSIAGGGYKKPIKNFVKGMNKADSEKVLEAVYTDDYLDDVAADADDFYDEMDESIEDVLDELEDEYGKHVKLSFDIEDKDKLDKDDLEDLEDEYDEYGIDVEIKKGYEVSGTLKVKGKDDEDETDLEFTVVKIKGEGWKIYPYSGDFSLLSLLYIYQ